MIPMTGAAFLARFPAADVLGGWLAVDLTPGERTAFYTNDAGEVGEAREDRRSTATAYALLDRETADQVVAYYAAEARREAADAAILAAVRPLLSGLSDAGRVRLKAGL